jgi:spore coat polysaccharide biosynthesis predicted glycosyltransferase SpsG
MKGNNNPNHLPKHRVPALIVLADGSQSLGVVFVRQGERVAEVLSKGGMFFPFLSKKDISLINKNQVIKIDIPTINEIREKEDVFPDVNYKYLENNNW